MVNASPGANLFEDDPFLASAIVPDRIGYVSIGFEGSLDIAGNGTKGDLTFGFDAASTVTLIALHSVAAAIVVPVLARRLAPVR